MPTPQFVIINTPGAAWNYEATFMQQKDVMKHAAYFFGLHAEGKVERGGPFLTVPGGMMVMVVGVPEEEVIAIAMADPGVTSGLLNYEIRQWMQAIQS
jgi:uncharacterized protein YciI